MARSSSRVSWVRRVGPFAAIGTAPAALMLGGGVMEQFPPVFLPSLLLGTLLILTLTIFQGRRGQHTGLAFFEIAIRVLGPWISRLASLLLTVLMVGWFAFGVGVGGTALAQVLRMPPFAGIVLYAALVAAVVQAGISRWNWLAVLSIAATAGFVIWSILFLVPPTPPALPSRTGSFPLVIAGASVVLGYAVAFALRSPDFTRDLRRERDVLLATGLGLGLPILAFAAVGAYLYLGFGTWDLPLLLASAGYPVFAGLFLVLGFVAGAIANLYSAQLSAAHLTGRDVWVGFLASLVAGTALAVAGFYQAMILWLVVLGIVVPPLIVTLVLGSESSRGTAWTAPAAWAIGTGAGLAAWLLGSEYYLLLGLLPPILILGIPRLRVRPLPGQMP